jgi:hypothetical protein
VKTYGSVVMQATAAGQIADATIAVTPDGHGGSLLTFG